MTRKEADKNLESVLECMNDGEGFENYIYKETKMENEKTCVLCGEKYYGFGHNAQPLKKGQCCDDCNRSKVILERINQSRKLQ